MSVFALKATAICTDLSTIPGLPAAEVVSSPFQALVEELEQELFTMLQSCLPAATAADLNAAMKNPTLVQDILINRRARLMLGTPRAVRLLQTPLVTAVKKVNAAATVEDTQSAMDEAASL